MKYIIILIILLTDKLCASKKIQLRTDLVPAPLEQGTRAYSLKSVLESYIKSVENKITRGSIIGGGYGARGSNDINDDQKNGVHVGSKIPILGSRDSLVYKGTGDYGFFTTIFEAYRNHWTLRTVPDDWWYTIIKQVAVAIDTNAEKEKVRSFFVNHKGKEDLEIEMSACTPHEVDYSSFFNQMTTLIQENIKVPGYVNAVRSDFTTSTSMHKIISEITIMTSTKQYFTYTLAGIMCGIPQVDMLGSEYDWIRLREKLLGLKQLLKPIESEIGLQRWWTKVEDICDKLLDTFRGNPDTYWWRWIFRETTKSGGYTTETRYDGWFIEGLLNEPYLTSFEKLRTGLVRVPMKLDFRVCGAPEEQSALVAGIAGMEIDTRSDVPIVQAKHGWSLFVEPNSTFVP